MNSTLRVEIADVSVNIPIFEPTPVSSPSHYMKTIPESTTVGTTIINITAKGSHGNSSISYSIRNDTFGKFRINATTGVVVLRSVIDREDTSLPHDNNGFVTLRFSVCAQIQDNMRQSSCAVVRLV